MPRELRTLTIDDYDALINLWADAGLPYRPLGRDSRDKIAVEMHRLDTAFIGLFENGRLIATALATYDGRKGWMNRLAVHPDERRRGLAAEVLRAGEEFLRSHGAEIIACLIEEWNLPSMEFATKHGYLHSPDVHYFSKRNSEDT